MKTILSILLVCLGCMAGQKHYTEPNKYVTNGISGPFAYEWNRADIPLQIFGYTEKVEVPYVSTNVFVHNVVGRFWTEWEVLEDQPQWTRATMEWQASNFEFATNNVYYVTNILWQDAYTITNWGAWSPPPCNKEHLDTTPQVEQTYTQSNLLAHLTWRGKTNTWCLESICCHTNTRTWNWEKRKVYK